MLLTMHEPEKLYAALVARDPAFDGHAFVGVTTTGIFCRLTCPARKPRFENTRFFETPAACLEAGFRPCLRCRPLHPRGEPDAVVVRLLNCLEQEPARVWREGDLTAMGLDPSTVRRTFKRVIGLTFLDLARLRRAGRGVERIAEGASVIEAQLEGGFDSGSGFRSALARILAETPTALKGCDLLKADWIDTPIGAMLAVADRHQLHLLEFFDRRALLPELTRLRQRTRCAIAFGRLPPIDEVGLQLRAYFAGHPGAFTTPLACHGSPFERQVWNCLRAIPPGTTTSYADLARSIGQPGATRAVARANGANQVAILIPCHRVVGSDGSLTGYGGGLWRKRWLLEHERKFSRGTTTGGETDGSSR